MDPDNEVFHGLDFETEADLVRFTRAFDRAMALAVQPTNNDGLDVTKLVDQVESFHLPAADSSKLLFWSSKIFSMHIVTFLCASAHWLSEAWYQLW